MTTPTHAASRNLGSDCLTMEEIDIRRAEAARAWEEARQSAIESDRTARRLTWWSGVAVGLAVSALVVSVVELFV